MPLPRIVIAVVAAITMLGAVLADLVIPDLAEQHAFNPNWPPHAKFHDAQYLVMTVLLGLAGLVLTLRPGPDARRATLCAAAVVAIPWLGMAGALLFPDTATYDPEFAERTVFVLGMHGQIFLALILLTVLFGAIVAVWRNSER
ncbi:hypothetical protein NBRGN_016_02370 [Nocardia brasiliensis NBRC 14402]|uniref:DUF6640 family protein n=1 Tax=Nocardia brasiliensis TaxID=37326 RepID=UPI00045C94ED|nr:DUF6640 family protein [Nocardia brasiliensis]ASF12574.1 hypothetical protein CEQ30_40360 [Nocardia brasiliensis]GAJ79851.1 hypothetical protein NBRGN_016_02370 [Nocardia brasiliensis NBRC 14402]SUB53582.1 Uncharacterised protein [Nocardia brasiliensis]